MIGEFESLIQSLFICQHNTPAFPKLSPALQVVPVHSQRCLRFQAPPRATKPYQTMPCLTCISSSLRITPDPAASKLSMPAFHYPT